MVIILFNGQDHYIWEDIINMKKGKCTVCKKVFTVKKGESLIGKLGIIPVDLCKTHLKKVLSFDEMNLNDTRV